MSKVKLLYAQLELPQHVCFEIPKHDPIVMNPIRHRFFINLINKNSSFLLQLMKFYLSFYFHWPLLFIIMLDFHYCWSPVLLYVDPILPLNYMYKCVQLYFHFSFKAHSIQIKNSEIFLLWFLRRFCACINKPFWSLETGGLVPLPAGQVSVMFKLPCFCVVNVHFAPKCVDYEPVFVSYF